MRGDRPRQRTAPPGCTGGDEAPILAALAGSQRGRAGVRAGSPHGRLSRKRACSHPAEGFDQAEELSIGSEVGKIPVIRLLGAKGSEKFTGMF